MRDSTFFFGGGRKVYSSIMTYYTKLPWFAAGPLAMGHTSVDNVGVCTGDNVKLIHGKCIAQCTQDSGGDELSGLNAMLKNMGTCVGSDVKLSDGQCTSSDMMGVCTGADVKLANGICQSNHLVSGLPKNSGIAVVTPTSSSTTLTHFFAAGPYYNMTDYELNDSISEVHVAENCTATVYAAIDKRTSDGSKSAALHGDAKYFGGEEYGEGKFKSHDISSIEVTCTNA